MDEVTRYGFVKSDGCGEILLPIPDGNWVRYEDYAKLEAQVAEADFNFGGWRAIKKRLEAQVAALEAQLTRIKEWCNAYPLEQFPEPDMQRFLIALGPQLLSELSAHNYRHVLNGIKAIIEGVSTGDAGTNGDKA